MSGYPIMRRGQWFGDGGMQPISALCIPSRLLAQGDNSQDTAPAFSRRALRRNAARTFDLRSARPPTSGVNRRGSARRKHHKEKIDRRADSSQRQEPARSAKKRKQDHQIDEVAA